GERLARGQVGRGGGGDPAAAHHHGAQPALGQGDSHAGSHSLHVLRRTTAARVPARARRTSSTAVSGGVPSRPRAVTVQTSGAGDTIGASSAYPALSVSRAPGERSGSSATGSAGGSPRARSSSTRS